MLKIIVLPLAYKSYVSMARMKELQPEMEALKERVGDDKQKLQSEMMQLYKDKKVNPAAGCLPILIQIPIFFALVQGDLRHHRIAPCAVLWLAERPVGARQLVDLQPVRAAALGRARAAVRFAALIFIGILPILLGITMWLQQKLNPAPTDPIQASDLCLDALGVHVHAGRLCQRAWWSTGSPTTSSPSPSSI